MEAFPAAYTEHNLPLIVLSGLGERPNDAVKTPEPALRDNGTQIRLASATCASECVSALLEQMLQFDASDRPWNASSLPGPAGRMNYKIRTTGRTYALPPRKAAPLAQPTSSDSFQNSSSSPPRSTELHSPLSPLSPGSPVYPDGVFTPVWFSKHQQHVPALIIGFFDLPVSSNNSIDDQIKADVNAVRAALSRSGYRTKFAAVMISDRSILQDPGLEERITSIRRSTGLDPKLGLFLMPPMSSQAEISTFVESMMKALQPLCVEFYRDLTKHARRKKTRVGPNPTASSPTGSITQVLSVSGWNVRYEIKQGVFAEFRQEMDVAERHYLTAIDELFGDEGILESMPTWSPRWNEARLLSDCLGLRVLRSQLWNGTTVPAAQFWTKYKSRIKSIVDRRGKGSRTYSWAAWEAKWAEIMAQLIIRAELPVFRQPQRYGDDAEEHIDWHVYATTEKTLASVERTIPYHNLHHPGYWLRLAARNARIRRQRAFDIPEEDRIPPGQSPASVMVKRTKSYDLYLAPEPHEESPLSASSGHDHTAECTDLTKQATEQFDSRAQSRMGDILRLDLARDFVAAEQYGQALDILRTLLDKTNLRSEGWDGMLSKVVLLAHHCALRSAAADEVLATTYELLSLGHTPEEGKLSLAKALAGLTSSPVSLHFEDGQRLCPVSIYFAFESKNTSVGDTIGCQLSCLSRLDTNTEPLILSTVQVSFDNGRSVRINHDAAQNDLHLVPGSKSNEDSLNMDADLTIAPESHRIFNFSMTFREARTVHLTDITLAIENDAYTITHSFKDEAMFRSDCFVGSTEAGQTRKELPGADSTSITVAPKPPKVQIMVQHQRKRYYTDELIRLGIEIVNGEEEAIDGSASVHVSGEDPIGLSWNDADASNADGSDPNVMRFLEGSTTKSIARLQSGESHKAELLVKAPSDPLKTHVEINVEYTALSDSATTIHKTIRVDMEFTAPFEPNSSFGPLLYADLWPNYFDSAGGSSEHSPEGIPQLWRLNTQLQCIAPEQLILHGAQIKIHDVGGESVARIRDHEDDEKHAVEPRQRHEYMFDLYTQKHSLDDRRPTSIESTLEVTWSRDHESAQTVTRLPLPRLTLPVSEPRVLCTRNDGTEDDGRTILNYHIENPSTHFLTFALTMEASEDFAFSGPKYQSVSLAPLSRHQVQYSVLTQDDDSSGGERWIWPGMQVVDSYYQKTLRVLPGGPHVKLDERQNIGVRVEQRTIGDW